MMVEMNLGTTALLTHGGGPRHVQVTRPAYVPTRDSVPMSLGSVLLRKPLRDEKKKRREDKIRREGTINREEKR